MTVTATAALAGAAQAGSVAVQLDRLGHSDGNASYNAMVAAFEAEYVGVNGSLNLETSNPSASTGTSASFTFSSLSNAVGVPGPGFNGGFDVDIASQDTGDFYYGDTVGLRNIDFNAGDEPEPGFNSLAIAFGNTLWSSNELEITLDPGVTSFGFNYEDIGDVGGELVVDFGFGASQVITLGPGNTNSSDGFIYAIAGAGDYITSITFNQNDGSEDDGFIFYGFSTVQAIPLPPAAFAGLGMLGALGVARRLRRH